MRAWQRDKGMSVVQPCLRDRPARRHRCSRGGNVRRADDLKSSANTSPTQAVTFEPDGSPVTIAGSLSLGAYASTTGPSYVTINGLNLLTINQFGIFWVVVPDLPTTRSSIQRSANPAQLLLKGRSSTLLTPTISPSQGNNIGPACCSSDGSASRFGAEVRRTQEHLDHRQYDS